MELLSENRILHAQIKTNLQILGGNIYNECISTRTHLHYTNEYGNFMKCYSCGKYRNETFADRMIILNNKITICIGCDKIIMQGFKYTNWIITNENYYRMFAMKYVLGSDIALVVMKNLSFVPERLYGNV